MSRPLQFLMVDEQQDQLTLVAEYLMHRNCQVEYCAGQDQIPVAMERHRAHGTPYDAIMIAVRKPDYAIVDRVHRRAPHIAIALCSPFIHVDPALAEEARCHGCQRVFDVPIDLDQVQNFLTAILNRQIRPRRDRVHSSSKGGNDDHTPFFGTSRVGRSSSSEIPANGTASIDNRSASHAYERGSSGYHHHKSDYLEVTPRQGTPRVTTSRYRRSVTGRIERTDPREGSSSYGKQPVTSAEGVDTASIPASQKKVACAFCNKAFMVQRKKDPYTVICIHCGQLNRIMP